MKISSTKIYAADEDEGFFDADMEEGMEDDFGDDSSMDEQLDDIEDAVDDLQDDMDDTVEDDPSVSIDNNIANHYIAECESCKGTFISAVIQSDQDIEYVSGVCPLCGKDTDQYLKWIIKDVNDASEEAV